MQTLGESGTEARCLFLADADQSIQNHSTESFAFAQPFPEDFEEPDHVTKGQRQLVVCPLFFNDPLTQRNFPTTPQEVEEYCKFKESLNYGKWETGGEPYTIPPSLTALGDGDIVMLSSEQPTHFSTRSRTSTSLGSRRAFQQ
jgi:hypothetical protein